MLSRQKLEQSFRIRYLTRNIRKNQVQGIRELPRKKTAGIMIWVVMMEQLFWRMAGGLLRVRRLHTRSV